MSVEGSRCLITGGLGFIGSNLAQSLALQGAEVTVVDNLEPGLGGTEVNFIPATTAIRADIGDVDSVSKLIESADFIFNLAGQTGHSDSMENPHRDLALNVKSQLTFLTVCAAIKTTAPIVYASTRQVYGRPDYLPVDETHPIRPVDINGIHKVAAETYHRLLSEVEGLNTCVVRLTNTYGPRMRVRDAKQTFVGVWIRDLLQGTPLKVFGSGEQLRDFTFVDDAVEAMISAALNTTSSLKTYNLGGGRPYTLNQVASILTELKPGTSFINVDFPPDRGAIDIGDFYGDFTKIRSELGWEPKIGLTEGLEKTVEFYVRNGKSYGI